MRFKLDYLLNINNHNIKYANIIKTPLYLSQYTYKNTNAVLY